MSLEVYLSDDVLRSNIYLFLSWIKAADSSFAPRAIRISVRALWLRAPCCLRAGRRTLINNCVLTYPTCTLHADSVSQSVSHLTTFVRFLIKKHPICIIRPSSSTTTHVSRKEEEAAPAVAVSL